MLQSLKTGMSGPRLMTPQTPNLRLVLGQGLPTMEGWWRAGTALTSSCAFRTGTSPSTSLTPMLRSLRTGMKRWMESGNHQ